MSNLEKARAVANEWIDLMGGLDNISYLYGDDIGVLVQAIHAAGLLMPDLPSRDFNTDRNDMNWIRVKNGMVQVVINSGYDSDYEVLTPGEAREYALTILAAADYAEKEQDNE